MTRQTAQRTLALVIPLIAIAGAALVGPLRGIGYLPGAPFHLPLLGVVAGFVAAELLAVEIESRSEAHSVNFVELTYVAALVFATPTDVVLGRVLAMAAVMGLVRRQSLHKLLVNVSMTGVEAAVACVIFHELISGTSPADPAGWAAIYTANLSAYLVSAALVTVAITVFSGFPGRRMIQQVMLVGGIVAFANTTVGIILVGSLWNESYLGLLSRCRRGGAVRIAPRLHAAR